MNAFGARLARRLRRHAPRGVILCYHRVAGPRLDPALLDVSPTQFATHLAALRTRATPLALREFERARRAGILPERAVAITFDDGYADNLHVALPLLEAAAMPATLFVTSAGIDASTEFWWDALARACYSADALPPTLELGGGPGDPFRMTLDEATRAPYVDHAAPGADTRRELYTSLSTWMRTQTTAVQSTATAAVLAWAGQPTGARDSHRTLTADELRTLSRSPLIEIGSHSVTHPVLGRLDSTAQVEECQSSRSALQRVLGAAPGFFAYPFGDRAAVTRTAEAAVRAAGYESAFTTDPHAAWRFNRRSSIPRIAMQPWDGAEFARRLERWFDE